MKLFSKILFIISISFIFILSTNAASAIGISKSTGGLTMRTAMDYNDDSNKLLDIPYNAEFKILDINKEYGKNCSNGWYKVSYNDKTGYVCSSLMQIKDGSIQSEVANDADYTTVLRNAGFSDSYIPYLTYLHQQHPNWEFVAKQTGVRFNDAVFAESACNANLVPSSDEDKYKNNNCGSNYHGYVTASSSTIAYYMDPRNFLNETNIFMFEDNYVNNNISDENYRNSVGNMFNGLYMYDQIPGLPSFITSAKSSGVSPISIASRIKQELGNGKLTSGKYKGYLYTVISGDYTDRYGLYDGLNFNNYYNFYNYGAADSCGDITDCALLYAYRHGWGGSGNKDNDRQKAISSGATIIKNNYLDVGQHTAYLQKFNVAPNNSNSRYVHQYMTNVRAAYSESSIIASAYKNLGLMNSSFKFYIPVYNDMPNEIKLPTDNNDKNYDGIGGNNNNTPTVDESKIDVYSAITGAGYRIEGSFLSNIALNSSVGDVKSNLSGMGLTVNIKDRNGNNVDSGKIGTGFKVIVVGSTTNEYNVVQYGDVSGDGKINALDLLKIQKYILKESSISESEKKAADASKDGKVNALDLLKVQKQILGETTISQ